MSGELDTAYSKLLKIQYKRITSRTQQFVTGNMMKQPISKISLLTGNQKYSFKSK